MTAESFPLSERDRVRWSILQDAPMDSWIALSHDESRMVAANADALEVLKLSQEAGEDDPILIKTPVFWGEIAYGNTEII